MTAARALLLMMIGLVCNSCSSLVFRTGGRDLTRVLANGVPRETIRARLGPPLASGGVRELDSFSYNGRTFRTVVQCWDAWEVNGLDKLDRDNKPQHGNARRGLYGLVLEEVLGAPWAVDFQLRQRKARYRLTVGYDAAGHYQAHRSDVLPGQEKILWPYPPRESHF